MAFSVIMHVLEIMLKSLEQEKNIVGLNHSSGPTLHMGAAWLYSAVGGGFAGAHHGPGPVGDGLGQQQAGRGASWALQRSGLVAWGSDTERCGRSRAAW